MRPQPVVLFALLFALALPAGAAEVQYFPVQAGDHPHDVAPAPDGTVWYTGQKKGVLGRLDPRTGGVERIPLGEGSRPHGVIVGPAVRPGSPIAGSMRLSASIRRARR
jgi:virginiamycin B lyase